MLLLRAGASSSAAGWKKVNVEQDAASDDSMPPLEAAGATQKQESGAAGAKSTGMTQDASSDDSMPPLDFVGSAAKEESDDDMPPLESVGSKPGPKTAVQAQPDAAESDDSMPPLDFVGSGGSPPVQASKDVAASAPSSPDVKVGDVVILKGLNKAELCGKQGVVLQASASDGDRVPVKLNGSGKKVCVKRENIEKVKATDAESDDSDMPPLEFAGAAAAKGSDNLPGPKTVAKAQPDDAESEDSMPPLECAGPASPSKTGIFCTAMHAHVRMHAYEFGLV